MHMIKHKEHFSFFFLFILTFYYIIFYTIYIVFKTKNLYLVTVKYTSIKPNIVTAHLKVSPDFAAKTSLTCRGMDSTRPQCILWYLAPSCQLQILTSPVRLQGEASMDQTSCFSTSHRCCSKANSFVLAIQLSHLDLRSNHTYEKRNQNIWLRFYPW